jgi:RNA-directed DNA polymerase
MNVDSSMCASSGKAAHWDQVDWPKCERQVGRLQARIVKATREGRWGKVKTLQRLLTCSFSGKALAVKRVTENQGRRTPGVDSVSWTTPADKLTAIGSLCHRSVQNQPSGVESNPATLRRRFHNSFVFCFKGIFAAS